MSRVRAKSLVLVNWRAVFYENYALDEHVTALEGDNGAGKTTVMIAAFVVLLPDMTRLRFTNVGEGEATGGDRGIYGRLGESSRPSYAVIEFELGRERVLAGVRLERKGEPSVELTAFVVSELPPSLELQDLLLLHEGDEDLIPELEELRENATRLGARFHRCRTIKDYFSTLFERGVTPLRMVSDEDRSRFADMLRTSMTGGISRSLTAELRSFLLKEERGLADTLVRMRGNLDACRRTRTEVHEARSLEREISAVYQAGHAMFSAALLAARERAEEMRRRVEEATGKRDEAAVRHAEVERERGLKGEEREDVARALLEGQVALESLVGSLDRVERANQIARRIAEHRGELEETAVELAQVGESLAQVDARRDQRERQQARAEQDYERAADGLADLQAGLEQLHRRANAHRMVKARVQEACEALGVETIDPSTIDERRAGLEREKVKIDAERGELDEQITGAHKHRGRHAEAIRALETILEQSVTADRAHDEATSALARLANDETLAAQLDELSEQLASAREQAEHQQDARRLAARLEREGDTLDSQAAVRAAVDAAERSLEGAVNEVHAAQAELRSLERSIMSYEEEQRGLERRAARWRELDALAARLEGELDAGLRDADELDAARELLDEHADGLRRRSDKLTQLVEQAKLQVRTLEHSGGAFPDGLLAVRDAIEGQLLAGYYDDIDLARAGRMEARLGPLAEAIVVEDVEDAAAQLGTLERTVDTVWLIDGERASALVELDEPGELDQFDGATAEDVQVIEANALRVTRVPDHPTLGRKARLRRIDELRRRVEALGQERGEVETEVAQVSSRRRELAVLLADLDTLHTGDPADELRQLAARRQEATRRTQALHERETELTAKHRASSRRARTLRELLAEAHWLDVDDLGQRVLIVEQRRQQAQRARGELARTRQARASLLEHVDALRRPPLSDIELADLRARFGELGARRQASFSALDALDYVLGHREALNWTDAQVALDEGQALLPALREQRTRARGERDSAVAAAREAREQAHSLEKQRQEIDGRHQAIESQLGRERDELAKTGVDDPSDAALSRARQRRDEYSGEVEALDAQQRALDRSLAALAERSRAHQDKLSDLDEQLEALERERKPSHERWEQLRSKAEEAGLISAALASRLLERGVGSVNFHVEARSKAELLLERVGAARGGDEILERIRAWLVGQESAAPDNHLQAWSVVRDWLRRRVPAQIAEVDEPLEALERLRNHLVALDARLARDEDTLRGTSEDVANGIDVHIRAATKQVKRLNQSLVGVHFGTIQSMRIRLERKPTMERMLGALRRGESQGLLFSPAMPIEQALQELFSRHGGGRSGGQKLLDYREYLTINVEILRQAETKWEHVNPSRVSTGEAIGIGAALMMVVLTAWERAANLLRARRSLGTLRLLFLDEANRLSRDNLEVLFDLCKNLDLQLLIAAPEVARAQGCTTYRLVRSKTVSGDEEVVVSGRRVRAEAPA